jgi:3'-5' exoribonuclease
MKSPYVSELQPNQVVTAIFLVQSKDIRQKRTGEPCLSLVLSDRTGEIEAKMWDNVAEVMDTFDRDDFLKIRGLVQIHQNRIQLTLHRAQRQAETDVDFTDYFPASERNPDEMFSQLMAMVREMGNEHLRALLSAIFADEDVSRRYKLAPAAKSIHHAYLGGLLEHVLSLCALAKLTAAHYDNVDADLLLAGVMLHDVGKIYELTYDRSFGYSSDGQLLGHIVIGMRMIGDKVREVPGFPPKLRNLLEHLVISHHGELEFGSPKVPLFPEALLLHHLDNLDSKMESMRGFLRKDRQMDGCWTTYSPSLERSVLKKAKYLADDAPAVSKPVNGSETAAESDGHSASLTAAKPVARPSSPVNSALADQLRALGLKKGNA